MLDKDTRRQSVDGDNDTKSKDVDIVQVKRRLGLPSGVALIFGSIVGMFELLSNILLSKFYFMQL